MSRSGHVRKTTLVLNAPRKLSLDAPKNNQNQINSNRNVISLANLNLKKINIDS